VARAGCGVVHRGGQKTFKADFCSISTPFLGLAQRLLWHRGDPAGNFVEGKGAKTPAKVLSGPGSPTAMSGEGRRRH